LYNIGWNFVNVWKFSTSRVVGDFNGDGRTDYAKLGDSYMHIFISKGDGTFWSPVYSYNLPISFGWSEDGWTTISNLDLDGDKKTDFIRAVNNNNLFIIIICLSYNLIFDIFIF